MEELQQPILDYFTALGFEEIPIEEGLTALSFEESPEGEYVLITDEDGKALPNEAAQSLYSALSVLLAQ